MTSSVIIISGLPCTGKTTLGRKLAQDLSLPLICRDSIKESLFDSLGWSDREWSKKLGIASYDLLYHFIDSLVSKNISLIVESNFKAAFDTEKYRKLQNQYGLKLIQIHCHTKGEVLLKRFKERSESGERHPGHVDHLNYEEFRATLLKGGYEILDVESTNFQVDTTDFNQVNYTYLFETLQLLL
ncbi:cytidylate kinase [Calothrix sp. NIES-4071]|nr:cytidylate kinase [Calothrix sp. NIES-4071]BAZ56914.1 cytidylate kinase [Calothrix sp. NIES-4105]